jgi:hypothetical protein
MTVKASENRSARSAVRPYCRPPVSPKKAVNGRTELLWASPRGRRMAVGLSPLSSERLRRPRAAGAASSTFDRQHLLSPPASFLPTFDPHSRRQGCSEQRFLALAGSVPPVRRLRSPAGRQRPRRSRSPSGSSQRRSPERPPSRRPHPFPRRLQPPTPSRRRTRTM